MLRLSVACLHLLVYPGLEVADVAMDTGVVLSAAVPPNALPSQPPHSILQGHQRAAAFSLAKSSKTLEEDFQLWGSRMVLLSSSV